MYHGFENKAAFEKSSIDAANMKQQAGYGAAQTQDPERPISGAMNTLADRISGLNDSVQHLTERLRPVLQPGFEAPKPIQSAMSAPPGRAPIAPLTSGVEAACDRLGEIADDVRNLLTYLDL